MQRRSRMVGVTLFGAASLLLCTGCNVTTLQIQDYAVSSAVNIVAQALVTLVASAAAGG